MSMNFDAYVLSIPTLKKELLKTGTKKKLSILDKALPYFGDIKGDNFLLMNVEYWEEYSPWSSFIEFLEGYYEIDTGYEVVENSVVMKTYSGANAHEVADILKIKLKLPEDEDESEDIEEEEEEDYEPCCEFL